MTQLTVMLHKVKIANDLEKGIGKINHLIFMDGMKRYVNNKK